jgi:hypothetical protein
MVVRRILTCLWRFANYRLNTDCGPVDGIETFRNTPTSVSVSHFLGCAIHTASVTPKHLICDKGQPFWCGVFKDWCDRQRITPRFGAVGQHGSIALIERFILSLKNEWPRSAPCASPHAHRSPATVALAFALTCAIIGAGSTCRSLL